jgi:hypothetical protein
MSEQDAAPPEQAPQTQSATEDQRVPYARFKAKVDALATAEAKLQALEAKGVAFDALQSRAAQLEGELNTVRSSFDRYRGLASRGFTDERLTEGFSRAYDTWRTTQGDGAADFATWLEGPAREDPFLAPHFEPAVSSAPAAAPPSEASPPPLRGLNGNARTPEPPRERLTPQQLESLKASMSPAEFSTWLDQNAPRYGISWWRSRSAQG